MFRKPRGSICAFLSIFCFATVLHAQGLLPTDWATPFRDAANTSNTSVVPPDDLKIKWQAPADGSCPLVYLTNAGQHLAISNRLIYDALTGELLATLSHEPGTYADRDETYECSAVAMVSDESNVTSDVLLTSRFGDTGDQLFAYDLSQISQTEFASQPMWSLDLDLFGEWCLGITAADGVFYVVGFSHADGTSVMALDALTGTKLWQSSQAEWGDDGGPLPGWVDYQTPAIANVTGPEGPVGLIFVILPYDQYLRGDPAALVALDLSTGERRWARSDLAIREQVCVDEEAGVVYAVDGLHNLLAIDALTGETSWNAPLDYLFHGPPTLGWAQDADGNVHEAVFGVEGGDDNINIVYAFARDSGTILWTKPIPARADTSAVYCGDSHSGKLYVSSRRYDPHAGFTFVLDAFSGAILQVHDTNVKFAWGIMIPPVIVEVGSEPMMLVQTEEFSSSGHLVAWSASGTIDPPPAERLLFADSFESGEWNGSWVEDKQNDWFTSTQRATDGSYSAEVDGRANNATLTMANAVDVSPYHHATLTFSWYIEKNWDKGEYIAVDVFADDAWHELAQLKGNVDKENAWHDVSIDLTDYLSTALKTRFRAKVSGKKEDGNVDNVKIIGSWD
jgi:outer membrane protein assembly factor BamB